MLMLIICNLRESIVGEQDSAPSFKNNGEKPDKLNPLGQMPSTALCSVLYFQRAADIADATSRPQFRRKSFLSSSSFITSQSLDWHVCMYIQEAFELVCRKQNFQNPKDYSFAHSHIEWFALCYVLDVNNLFSGI